MFKFLKDIYNFINGMEPHLFSAAWGGSYPVPSSVPGRNI